MCITDGKFNILYLSRIIDVYFQYLMVILLIIKFEIAITP